VVVKGETVNKTILVGDDETLHCTTTESDPVDWYHYSPSYGENQQRVVSAGLVVDFKHQRYALIKQPSGTFDLMIHNARSEDTGWYECVAEAGAGDILQTFFLNVSTGKSDSCGSYLQFYGCHTAIVT
jgi:hypothetical protein